MRQPGTLASLFTAALVGPGWYVNVDTDDQTFVVLPRRIVRHRHGDEQRRVGTRCGAVAALSAWPGRGVPLLGMPLQVSHQRGWHRLPPHRKPPFA